MPRIFITLRGRLIMMVILALIPAMLLLLRTGFQQRADAIQAAQEEVVHLGQVASLTHDVMISSMKAFLQTVAHVPSIRRG
mgnify:CR=1 FL=1